MIFVSPSPHTTVSRTGRLAEKVTAANLAIVCSVVVTGAMLATSRMADWREEGSTVAASLLLFSCIPVSLSGKNERESQKCGTLSVMCMHAFCRKIGNYVCVSMEGVLDLCNGAVSGKTIF